MGGIHTNLGQRYYPAGGGGGGAAYTEDIQESKRDNRTTNTTIPATALNVYVENVAASGDITVNGITIGPGGIWSQEAEQNPATSKMELCEEVIIIGNGVEYSFKANYPSTTLVNVAGI